MVHNQMTHCASPPPRFRRSPPFFGYSKLPQTQIFFQGSGVNVLRISFMHGSVRILFLFFLQIEKKGPTLMQETEQDED